MGAVVTIPWQSLKTIVAMTYGILTGRPVYFFDTTTGKDVLAAKMISWLG